MRFILGSSKELWTHRQTHFETFLLGLINTFPVAVKRCAKVIMENSRQRVMHFSMKRQT
jgi:hypothetical protein